MHDSQDELNIQESVVRFIQCAKSEDHLYRRRVGSTALETLPIVASSPQHVSFVLEVVSTIAVDPDVHVRCSVLEYIVHIALLLSDPNKSCETLRSFITSHVLPIIVTALLDAEPKVVKIADVSLIALLEHCLVPNGYVQERIWPAIIKKMKDCLRTESFVRVMTLMRKMVPWVGCDTTETLFVPIFIQLCTYPDPLPRKACACIIGDFCAVVSPTTVEDKLMPCFLKLCGDPKWLVRKTCADMFTSVSSAVSPSTRSERLAPAFVGLLSDPVDNVRSAAFQSLGPFITTFAEPSVISLAYNHQGKLVLKHQDGFEFQLNANIELNPTEHMLLRENTSMYNSRIHRDQDDDDEEYRNEVGEGDDYICGMNRVELKISDSSDDMATPLEQVWSQGNSVEVVGSDVPSRSMIEATEPSGSLMESDMSSESIGSATDQLNRPSECNSEPVESDDSSENVAEVRKATGSSECSGQAVESSWSLKSLLEATEQSDPQKSRSDYMENIGSDEIKIGANSEGRSFSITSTNQEGKYEDMCLEDSSTPDKSAVPIDGFDSHQNSSSLTIDIPADPSKSKFHCNSGEIKSDLSSSGSESTGSSELTTTDPSIKNNFSQLHSIEGGPASEESIGETKVSDETNDSNRNLHDRKQDNSSNSESSKLMLFAPFEDHEADSNPTETSDESAEAQGAMQKEEEVQLPSYELKYTSLNSRDRNLESIIQSFTRQENRVKFVYDVGDLNFTELSKEEMSRLFKNPSLDREPSLENEIHFREDTIESLWTERVAEDLQALTSLLVDDSSLNRGSIHREKPTESSLSGDKTIDYGSDLNLDGKSEEESDFSEFSYWRDPIPDIDIDPKLVYKPRERSSSVTTGRPPIKRNKWKNMHSAKPGQPSTTSDFVKSQSDALFDAFVSLSKSKAYLMDTNGNDCEEGREDEGVVPKGLISFFVSMSSPCQDKMRNDLAHHCAFNLPAVALTLGPTNWPLIKQACVALAADQQWRVRRVVASSIHELAVIVGSEVAAEDLVPVFLGFIKDLDEVRIGALKHLANFLKLLKPTSRTMFLPRLSEFLVTDYDWNWRFRGELAEQLLQIVRLFSAWETSDHLVPIVFSLLQDKVAEVRTLAIDLVIEVIHVIKLEGVLVRRVVAELAEVFAHSARWARRQTFAHLCSKLVQERALPLDLFARDILPHLLDLSWDKVANVRLSVARTLSHHIMALDMFSDPNSPHHEVVTIVLRRLQGDRDRDVRFFAAVPPLQQTSELTSPDQLPESSTPENSESPSLFPDFNKSKQDIYQDNTS